LVTPVLFGCQADGSLSTALWAIDASSEPINDINELESLGMHEQSSDQIALSGGANESLSFLFTVMPRRQSLVNPDLKVETLTGRGTSISDTAISIFRMHKVRAENWPGWHIRSVPPPLRVPERFDVLVPYDAPLGGLPKVLEAGSMYHFWVDVTIPRDAFEGVYNGRLVLSANKKMQADCYVQLTVLPYVLPDDPGVTFLADLDHQAIFRHHVEYRGKPYAPGTDDWRNDPNNESLTEVLFSTIDLVSAARIVPVFPDLSPTVSVGRHGEVLLAWDQYDAVAAYSLEPDSESQRVAAPLWPVPARPILMLGETGSRQGDANSHSWSTRYLQQCLEHFARKGWIDRGYLCNDRTARFDDGSMKAFRRFASLCRMAGANAGIVSPYFPQDPRPFGWVDFPVESLTRDADIWMPRAQFFDPGTLAQEKAGGRQIWFHADRPPFSGSTSIYASPADTMVLPWQATRHGVDAVHLGRINAWPGADDTPDPETCANHDSHALIYPGKSFGLDRPVPSVRLFRLRRAIEDAALRRILRKRQQFEAVDSLEHAMVGRMGVQAYRTHFSDGYPGGWPRNASTFDLARKIITGELMAMMGDTREDSEFRRSLLWRRLFEETRGVRLTFDGARVRLENRASQPMATIDFSLTIDNNSRRPVDGMMSFPSLPPAWQSQGDPQVATVPSGQTRRVVSRLAGPSIPTGPGGLTYQWLAFGNDDAIHDRIAVTIACVTAEWFKYAPAIDGELADWPAGVGNVASGFSVIADVAPLVARTPIAGTKVMVGRDQQFLYVAFHCDSMSENTERNNRVIYDDMIPTSGESFEIMLDPLNAESRSPADIHHVLVKRSGSCLTEVGVGFDPPCGKRSPWAVDITYAVHDSPDAWSGEVRIPIANLTPVDESGTVWGINFARFDAENREYSTWSGSVGNSYDPLSFGNVVIPFKPVETP
jgi:hypothetical protein